MSTRHTLYTIGFTQKTAEQFFGLLADYKIEALLDVRASNTSQLAAFTKRDDLAFFLDRILGVSYYHLDFLAPTKEIRDTLKSPDLGWPAYEQMFNQLLGERDVINTIDENLILNHTCCLLCSEPTAEHCHRRLVAEHLADHWPQLDIHHI
jgi:uncharacterized protein (DUF488 family)